MTEEPVAAKRVAWMLGLVGILLASVLAVPQTGLAQDEGVPFATVTAPADYLAQTRGSSEETWAETYEHLEVYADGRLCGVMPLLSADGQPPSEDPEFELGLNGQPDVCSQPGARLSYIDSGGRILFQKDYLEPGGEYMIDSFGPEPPSNPTPYPQVLIPARVLDTAEADAIGRLQVVAAGEVCGEIALTDPAVRNEDGDIVFYTHPYEGRICGDPREDELRFADPQGRLLQERFAFDFNRPMVLFDFALADSGQTVPLPPSVGTGLDAGSEAKTPTAPAVFAGLGLAMVAWSLILLGRRAG